MSQALNKCYLLILMILRANGTLALSKCEKNVQGIPGLHRYIWLLIKQAIL